MESKQEINDVLAAMGEPPLDTRDVIQTTHRIVSSGDAPAATDVETTVPPEPRIELREPKGHRRANLYFLNGRVLFIDMQDDELLQTIRDFLRDLDPQKEFLTLPLIDTVGEGKDEVTVAAPIHLARKQLELLSSVGRSWMKQVPGEATTGSGIAVVRGSEAAGVLNLNREQRRRLGRNRG